MLKGLSGMGDMMGLMKKAQKMKKDMKNLKKEISRTNITVSDESDNLIVIINGDHLIQKITFSSDAEKLDSRKLAIIIQITIDFGSQLKYRSPLKSITLLDIAATFCPENKPPVGTPSLPTSVGLGSRF